MTDRMTRGTTMRIVRRDWLIVLACMIAAIATATLASLGAQTVYEAQARIELDTVSIGQNARFPRADQLIAYAQSATLASELADRHGLTVEEVESELNAFSVGTAQERVIVGYAAHDRDLAERIAQSAAQAVSEYGYEVVGPFLEMQHSLIEDGFETLDVLEPLVEVNPLARFNVWTVRRSVESERFNLTQMEQAYLYDGTVSVVTRTREEALLRAAVGGAIAGLALAGLLVVIREVLARREMGADACET